MFGNIRYTAAAVLAVLGGLAAIACGSAPCQACGFAANANVVITDSAGRQRQVVASSSGCVAYTCGSELTMVQVGGQPHVVHTGTNS